MVDFEQELTDHGGGRIISEIHETYSVEATGELAFSGDRRIELTIRDGSRQVRDATRRLSQST